MFEVPHYHFHIEQWKDIKLKVLSSLKVKEPNNIPSGAGYSVTTSYWDTFDYTNYLDFLNVVNPYVSTIPNTSRITRVWYQTSQQYDFHTAHTHGSQGWSAVFYANFIPEVHVPTKFYCPFPNVEGHIDLFCPKVKEGDLIVFPANILHEAPINTSKVPRTIISFNLI